MRAFTIGSLMLIAAAVIAFYVLDYHLTRILEQLREIAETLHKIRVQRS